MKTHPIQKILNNQKNLGIVLLMDNRHHSDPTILKRLADVLDDNVMTAQELEALCLDIHQRVRIMS
ncbi:hypothetical protein DDN60_12575 [Vibrio cholerae]|nr:hypothetical protein [Vibrio cholerae]